MTSLLEDVKAWYEDESYPPAGHDLDYGKETTTKEVAYEVVDDSPRWGNKVQIVFKRGNELVAVEDVEPATEMQDWGDYGDPDIYEAKPVEVTVIRYERA